MFYENFERICKDKHTSPSGALVKIGKSRSLASSWKRQGTVPKQTTLDQLAKLLDCEVSDFFRNEQGFLVDETAYRIAMDEGNVGAVFHEDGNIAEFIKIYNACSTRQKHQLMEAVFDFEDKVLNAEQDIC